MKQLDQDRVVLEEALTALMKATTLARSSAQNAATNSRSQMQAQRPR